MSSTREPKIRGLTNDIHACNIAWVGQDGVTRIEETEKPGQMAMVPWYRVYRGDDLFMEVNAAQVGGVVYFPEESS